MNVSQFKEVLAENQLYFDRFSQKDAEFMIKRYIDFE